MSSMKPSVLDKLVGTEYAASVLGVDRHTVACWVADGSLPGARIGPTYVLLRGDVKALAAERNGTRP